MKVKVKIGEGTYEVLVGDVDARPVIVMVDGERFEVWPEVTATVDTPPPNGKKNNATAVPEPAPVGAAQPRLGGGPGRTVRAPLPGVCISVRVKPGDMVAAGQELVVIEAMKMKNSVRATRTGEIGVVQVKEGQHVKHRDVLLEYSE